MDTVSAWLDRAAASVWDALVARATGELAGDDLLEVQYWAVRAALRDSDRARAARVLGAARPATDDFPLWRRRIDSLAAALAALPAA